MDLKNTADFLQRHQRIILILIIAFFIRAFIACSFFGSYDSIIAENMHSFVFKTGDIDALYREHAGLQHFPGWIWLLGLIGLCSKLTGISYHILFKFPAIFADLAITILIYKTFLRWGYLGHKSSNLAMGYALNPVPIIISSINGQFDTLTTFFCLLAWYFYIFSNRFKIASALFLGIGVIIKEFPMILFPAFWGKLKQVRERAGYIGYFLLPIIIAIIIAYFTTTLRFIPLLVKYNSTSGLWGLSLIAKYLSHNFPNKFFMGFNVFVGQGMRYISLSMLILIWFVCFKKPKKQDLLASIMLVFTAFYFVAPGGAATYLVWIIPFAVINRDSLLKFYTSFVSVIVLLWFVPCIAMKDPAACYNSIKWLNFTRNLFSVLAWITTGIWTYKLARRHLSHETN